MLTKTDKDNLAFISRKKEHIVKAYKEDMESQEETSNCIFWQRSSWLVQDMPPPKSLPSPSQSLFGLTESDEIPDHLLKTERKRLVSHRYTR